MTNKKPATGVIQEAGYSIAPNNRNYSPFSSKLKVLIMRLAVCGLLPIHAAEWIIRRGGMRDA